MRFDGYYMMSDFLEIPNLRQKSDKLLKEAFSWYCLGIESKPDPFMPETGRGWFITYAIAAWCYRWVVLASISLFLYTVLKPYDLQSLGITMLVFSMGGILFTMVRSIWQIVATPRMEPMSKTKIAVSSLLAGAVVYGLLSIPVPWYHEAPCVLEPQGVVQVPSPVKGRIVTPVEYDQYYRSMVSLQDVARRSVLRKAAAGESGRLLIDPDGIDLISKLPAPDRYARPPQNGDLVAEGDVIAVLEQPEDLRRDDELRKRLADLSFRSREIADYERINDLSGANSALAEALELIEQIRELTRLNEQRIVLAPVSGRLIAARRVPEPQKSDIDPMKLRPWHGTPLDARNSGCSVEQGQELVSIAPTDKVQAVMYIDQGDRDDLTGAMDVQIKLDHLADITWLTRVTSVSLKGEVMAPEALTTRFNGPLATKADTAGQEQLASTAYRAIAELHFEAPVSAPDAVLMRPGMRGNARFLIHNRTLAYWGWRYICETFRFRV
jgi:putative peptide zinc metalloprotease protein